MRLAYRRSWPAERVVAGGHGRIAGRVPGSARDAQLMSSQEAQGTPLESGPLVIERQGSFFVGGTVLRQPGAFDPHAFISPGETVHGDHAYVQFQVPPR